MTQCVTGMDLVAPTVPVISKISFDCLQPSITLHHYSFIHRSEVCFITAEAQNVFWGTWWVGREEKARLLITETK